MNYVSIFIITAVYYAFHDYLWTMLLSVIELKAVMVM